MHSRMHFSQNNNTLDPNLYVIRIFFYLIIFMFKNLKNLNQILFLKIKFKIEWFQM
jgi:hypothetical protein